jgi:hypothetical protein
MAQMGGELSAVMPVKLSGRHYGNNVGYCDTLFSSFRHFGLGEVFSEFLIVVVPSEAETVRRYAEAWSDFPIRIVPEDELLPIFQRYNRPHQVRPWHRQQMIKMACSTIVESDTYLSLDPDVIAVKQVAVDVLMPDGLPLLDPETRSFHPDWWIDSARLLGVEPNLEAPGVHATPILYRSEVWAKCFSRLEEVQKKPWDEVLITTPETWTEMALYYLTLENFFEPAAVHRIGSETTLHSSVEFWSKEDFEQKELSAFFSEDNPGLFGVLSSSSRVDPRETAVRLTPWIPVTIQPYEVEDSLRVRAEEFSEKVVRYLRLRFKF